MEFKIGQKYRIIDASKMWDRCIYDENGDYAIDEYTEFESGDVLDVVELRGELCFKSNIGYSQDIKSFNMYTGDYEWCYYNEYSIEEVFKLLREKENE